MRNKSGFEAQFGSIMLVIKYVHQNPFSGIKDIIAACNVSRATFYRILHYVSVCGVAIKYMDIGDLKGYTIVDYGAFSKSAIHKLAQ